MEFTLFCNQEILLNKSLLRAIVRNDIKDITHLISLGADVNFECTIDQLISLNILDANAIEILKNAQVTIDELIEDGCVGGTPEYDMAGFVRSRMLENGSNPYHNISDGTPIKIWRPPVTNEKQFHIYRDEFTSIIRNSYSKLIILPIITNKIILTPKSKLSPLQLAIMYGSREATIELIKKGADPNDVLDVQNITILQLMCTAAVLKNKRLYVFDEDIIQLLFDHGADPNIKDVNGRTFLHFAVCSSDFHIDEMVQRRMKMQTDPNYVYDHRDIKRIEKYLTNGANPNIKDEYHFETVLYHIVQHDSYLKDQPNLTNLFLDHGGIYYTNNYTIEDPESYARKDIDEFNLEHRHYVEKNNSLIEAIKNKDKSKIEISLSEGISPNIRDKDGLSALHIAVKIGDYDIIKLLLRNGANPNIKSWKNGTTPIFNAVIDNVIVLVDLLAEFRANPSVMNTKRMSPLYFSVTNNSEKMTKMLLVHDANPDISRYFFVLFGMLNDVFYDGNMKVIESILNKIYNLSVFLKSRDIQIYYHLFYNTMDNAEINNRGNVARKIREVLDKLIPPIDCSDVKKIDDGLGMLKLK